MNTYLDKAAAAYQCAVKLIETWFAPLASLAARLYVAHVFFASGLTKVQDWDTTIALFTDEYHVPLLPPELAAFGGAAGELGFSVLLALGLGGRLSALGLSLVNIMAVVSYWHVLMLPDQVAGLNGHIMWGLMLALLLAKGTGTLSVDTLIGRWFFAKRDKQAMAAA
ncbi:MAG: DoxX family protein [Burkholderiales bacterium]|nr:DoxX family protein [Burkholderiales bacterium]